MHLTSHMVLSKIYDSEPELPEMKRSYSEDPKQQVLNEDSAQKNLGVYLHMFDNS